MHSLERWQKRANSSCSADSSRPCSISASLSVTTSGVAAAATPEGFASVVDALENEDPTEEVEVLEDSESLDRGFSAASSAGREDPALLLRSDRKQRQHTD